MTKEENEYELTCSIVDGSMAIVTFTWKGTGYNPDTSICRSVALSMENAQRTTVRKMKDRLGRLNKW